MGGRLCGPWWLAAKGRGQCRHRTRDRHNHLHFMVQWGSEEFYAYLFFLTSQLVSRLSVPCAYSYPECTETSQRFFSVSAENYFCIFIGLNYFQIYESKSLKKSLLPDRFEIFCCSFWWYLMENESIIFTHPLCTFQCNVRRLILLTSPLWYRVKSILF